MNGFVAPQENGCVGEQRGVRGMKQQERVIVVGGGIGGLAAALRLAEYGQQVTLLERRSLLGGRASSFPIRGERSGTTPGTAPDDLVDNCQHVLMRCCVNLLDFYNRIGAADAVKFSSQFSFVDTAGQWSSLEASPWLPAPFHLIPSLLRFRSMSVMDKLSIAYGMARLMILQPRDLQSYESTFGEWLKQSRQTRGAIECFWRPVIVSALNEEPERTAAPYGFQLFREAFLRNRRAYEMGLPTKGLAHIYSEAGMNALRRKQVDVRMEERVERICVEQGKAAGVVAGGRFRPSSTVVSAVPQHVLPGLLDPQSLALAPFCHLGRFDTSPITGVHLWFDVPVADTPHAALLGREMQWIFVKDGHGDCPEGSCVGLVVSASRSLTGRPKAEIVALALKAVHDVFPRSRKARLVRDVVIREPNATFSPAPGIEKFRPHSRTAIEGLYVAGDWIRTGWPATMEGAVRGGYLAAEAVLQDAGQSVRLLAEEMPADWMPKRMGLG